MHHIAAPLPRVEAALLDPATLAALPAFAAVESAELLALRDDGDVVVRHARIRPAWSLPVPRRLLAWDEDVRWRRSAHAGDFVVRLAMPGPLARRVRCVGRYTLTPQGTGTCRRIDGALDIDLPGVGSVAERQIVPLLQQHFAGEAALLTDRAAP